MVFWLTKDIESSALHITMKGWNGTTRYANYSSFKIFRSPHQTDYILTEVGEVSIAYYSHV